MIGAEVLYAPCPCGSGKKFKFCCYGKYREFIDDETTPADVVEIVRTGETDSDDACAENEEAFRLIDQGDDLSDKGRLVEAQEKYHRSRVLVPRQTQAWKLEAECAWLRGDIRAAYEIQREGNVHLPIVDAGGLASLAVYAHALGFEAEARAALDHALVVTPLSVSSVLQVCCALALYHRNRDLLEYAAWSGMAESEDVTFLTGVAHANLGEIERAQTDLTRARSGYYSKEADYYLGLIDDNISPMTPAGWDAWCFFSAETFTPARILLDNLNKNAEDPYCNFPRALAEECIVILLGDRKLTSSEALELARKLEGETAERLVKALEDIQRAIRNFHESERAARLADVDAQGRPRYPFNLTRSVVDEFEELSTEQKDLLQKVDGLIRSNDPKDAYSRQIYENILNDWTTSDRNNLCVLRTYWHLVDLRDPKCAEGILRRFYEDHLDDPRGAGEWGLFCVLNGKLAEAAEVFDRFALPPPGSSSIDNVEWSMFALALSCQKKFAKMFPALAARVSEVLAILNGSTAKAGRRSARGG